jgi:cyclohexyl-isocyanide hydratase
MTPRLRVAIPLFGEFTALDGVGPYEVLQRIPTIDVTFIGHRRGEFRSENGMLGLTADATFAELPQPDVIVFPGGVGTRPLQCDDNVLDWVRHAHATTRFTTSVCTGSLVLGAAGLLRDYRAATHWSAMDYLAPFGAMPTRTRVCVDRNRITGGGVTAGIDFALTLVSLLTDQPTAEAIQLGLEYNPAPPFDAGSPDTAPPAVLALVQDRIAKSKQRREQAVERAAARLNAA